MRWWGETDQRSDGTRGQKNTSKIFFEIDTEIEARVGPGRPSGTRISSAAVKESPSDHTEIAEVPQKAKILRITGPKDREGSW
jgi:2,4-dienoyl-CoA reductase-like NADH-dependent reductase (Old Yellow Enzyme family)